ncbi:hypothetical protein BpHYR1_046986 [Brachionus plicatilis]|uniref:Uncharacterized protein n=1 Tax=Brachionus plicatilis TaxID=10195 RepID=A0A3M7SDH3_BRAPC|nr:hypothetical protein BpHYR1_046986 [Brachionus plicatilis]
MSNLLHYTTQDLDLHFFLGLLNNSDFSYFIYSQTGTVQNLLEGISTWIDNELEFNTKNSFVSFCTMRQNNGDTHKKNLHSLHKEKGNKGQKGHKRTKNSPNIEKDSQGHSLSIAPFPTRPIVTFLTRNPFVLTFPNTVLHLKQLFWSFSGDISISDSSSSSFWVFWKKFTLFIEINEINENRLKIRNQHQKIHIIVSLFKFLPIIKKKSYSHSKKNSRFYPINGSTLNYYIYIKFNYILNKQSNRNLDCAPQIFNKIH